MCSWSSLFYSPLFLSFISSSLFSGSFLFSSCCSLSLLLLPSLFSSFSLFLLSLFTYLLCTSSTYLLGRLLVHNIGLLFVNTTRASSGSLPWAYYLSLHLRIFPMYSFIFSSICIWSSLSSFLSLLWNIDEYRQICVSVSSSVICLNLSLF